MAAKLIIELLGKADSAIAALKKTGAASQEATSAVGTTGKTLAGIAGAVAAGMAVKRVVDFGKSTVAAAGEAAHANKQLTAVMANTGSGFQEATKHAIELADSLGRQVGVSPNVIKAGESILATFHSVSGEVGMQAGIFDRATKAGADLAAAGFGSIESNAVQLGKALEDPTKGLTALAKSGVTFTKSQKEQIAAMTAGKASAEELAAANLKIETSQVAYNEAVKKYGPDSLQARNAAQKLSTAQEDLAKSQAKGTDLLGAQKIVLEAVESQVAGTAKATAGAGAKMAVAYEEMKVKIGTALLPAVSSLKGEFTKLFDFISANSAWLVPLISGVAVLAGALVAIVGAVKMFTMVMESVKLAIAGVRLAMMLLNTAFLTSPIGWIVLAVVALIAVIVLIATKTTWFQTIWAAMTAGITAAWNATVGAVVAAWNWVWGILSAGFNAVQAIAASVLNWIRGNWPLLVGVLAGPFGIAVALVIRYWTPISGFFAGIVGAIGGAFSRVIGVITQPFITAFNIVRGAVDSVVSHIQAVVGGVLSFVSGAVATAKSVYNAFAHMWNAIPTFNIPEVDTHIPGIGKVGGGSIGLPKLPTLALGGLMTRSGLVFAHAGEVISPAPARARGDGPLVAITNAHFSEKIDVATFGRRLAWEVETAGV